MGSKERKIANWEDETMREAVALVMAGRSLRNVAGNSISNLR